ncbi:hypothetical protein JCGZ_04180 [Jatropha curcas]|uniref:Uncharacterized protein n=1 Tax=Jatropha curcas TaxID=180498 RepID=A0A067JCY7_JATCU|nr:hypothetical protein JCGZ_04180 [Jatropha curcas]
MSQISEIPASAYTPEMEVLGALPDIPMFDGEPVSVSRNPLTPGTRPLQLLPLPGLTYPVRNESDVRLSIRGPEQLRNVTNEMRGAASWSRDTSVLGATHVEQLCDAAVEWRGASIEMRYAAMLLIA